MDELIGMSALDVVALLRRGEVSPLELIDAVQRRAGEVEPLVNALPTTCFERAREHARDLMAGRRREAESERGWLAGLPLPIKDLTDVAGVRTTYGSPIFRNHVPTQSNPLVARIERKGGIIIGKSNTPEFGAGGNTFNEVFGRTLNPWNTALTCGGSSGGAAVALATGETWLAHGSDQGGSLRVPATLCSVVGLRPSPGRVTRGTANHLWSPLSVQGPMARTVADLALFLDTMAGVCAHDPMTFDAPATAFLNAALAGQPPKRVAFTADYGGTVPVSPEVRDICTAAALRFAEAGCVVEEAHPDLGPADEVFLALRSQDFVVEKQLLVEQYRDQFKPDILWNTEVGLKQSAARLAWAERERAALYQRFVAFFERYDVLVTPGTAVPAWDVSLRTPVAVEGEKRANYLSGATLTSAITMTSCPALSLPCGFDRFGRPVGLQIIAPPRGDAAAIAAGAVFEAIMGVHKQLPIDPRSGVVPAGG